MVENLKLLNYHNKTKYYKKIKKITKNSLLFFYVCIEYNKEIMEQKIKTEYTIERGKKNENPNVNMGISTKSGRRNCKSCK